MTAPLPIYPPSTLLLGAAGVGKTYSIATLLAAGLKVRLLATEPSAPNRVLAACEERNISADRFDWQFVSPVVAGIQTLIDSAKLLGTLSLESIAKMPGGTGIAKQQSVRWIEFLQAIGSFTSARTGELLGDATEWGDDTAFVIDNLTGMSMMARALIIGAKPNPSPGEWGTMQSAIYDVLVKLTSDCKCFFVLLSHVEKETNEITGIQNLMASTLGAKLAPKLPGRFTNVIYARKAQDGAGLKFLWSTAEAGVDTKNGDMPISNSLAPDFALVIAAYRKQLASLTAPSASPQTASAKPTAA